MFTSNVVVVDRDQGNQCCLMLVSVTQHVKSGFGFSLFEASNTFLSIDHLISVLANNLVVELLFGTDTSRNALNSL